MNTDASTPPPQQFHYDTDIAVQRAEEREIAFAEGEARGSRQTKLETAKNLLQFGLSQENIAQATGLTVQEVQSIGHL